MRVALLLVLVVGAGVALGGLRLVRGGSGDVSPPAAQAQPSPTVVAARRFKPVPLVKQRYRNNCETAALSMLLAAAGVDVGQRQLQQEVPKSGTPDPVIASDGTWTWGDPELGFVGRSRGGGVAGGFGVYDQPIKQLARSHGVELVNLSNVRVSQVIGRLRDRRPVLAWVGLSDGPYRRWRAPDGRPVVVNLGEHAVVLTRIDGDMIVVNDPLTGTRRRWTVPQFTAKWKLLGRRALGL